MPRVRLQDWLLPPWGGLHRLPHAQGKGGDRQLGVEGGGGVKGLGLRVTLGFRVRVSLSGTPGE